MEILHLCSYYIGNKLYKSLIKQLHFSKVNQSVFIPVRSKDHIGKNQLPSQFHSVKYYYSNILEKYDKLFYFNKIKKQMKEVERSILKEITPDFIHAHTVFSDGGTAYKLFQKYGINYIVNVRNTDINTFYKYGVHLRPFMNKILINSKGIIFLSYPYKEKLLSYLPPNIVSQIQDKCYVIPNGIDEFWHTNIVSRGNNKCVDSVKLIFMGRLDENKNLRTVILTCDKLCEQGYNASLEVIGSGPFEEDYMNLCNRLGLNDRVTFHGYISDKDKIAKLLDESDLYIMPSFKETFGLVYIEAMSRGLPVIYTKGQGIDGFFNEGEVGYAVNPKNVNMITERVIKILTNYSQISKQCINNSRMFNWNDISNKYLMLYKESTLS